MILPALTALSTATLLACSGTGGGDLPGLSGVVLRGPVRGGPARQGMPDTLPFAAELVVTDASGREVARLASGDDGRFCALLAPGRYTVRPAAGAPVIAPERQVRRVEVGASGLTEVELRFDTGLR